MSASKRKEERVEAELPVSLGSARGTTRDISATGVFFETDTAYAMGSEISFSVELNAPGGKMMLKCQGRIVRVENRGGKIGMAAKIIESRLKTVEEFWEHPKAKDRKAYAGKLVV